MWVAPMIAPFAHPLRGAVAAARRALGLMAVAVFAGAPAQADEQEPLILAWEDLWPEGEEEVFRDIISEYMQDLWDNPVVEGSPEDGPGEQIGTFNVVHELDGQEVQLPGYAVPFDFRPSGIVGEFLLVPYFGACLHVPPPPPNQTVYVTTGGGEDVDLPELWQPIWVHGVMRTTTHESDLADAAYTLIVEEVELFER